MTNLSSNEKEKFESKNYKNEFMKVNNIKKRKKAYKVHVGMGYGRILAPGGL